LDQKKEEEITFTFEGKELKGFKGETVAAALIANGVRVFRRSTKDNRPRGLFCAIGNCSSCLMKVDGESNVRTCMKRLEEGMEVQRQEGEGEI
ncbi:(2Fe-2S)-binding protein, partial [Candidatus Bipolaricaulota bacterium]|nr:(2Fe-2S)-binding protein [Candidatus Bipolaricaulota bacterium]